ncbi:hypothetical protein WKH56_10150 [Priestia sp. SB1]|uniref:Uncharacterized protein n=1 Tax=Priestia aryabhattai TaxID=412384 RepID=A0AAX6NCR8_PRIAR|nr:hypothetical protein [Priestia aryabhattai]MDU9693688.1 hypothetical protein [Priestia aryabhattai]
MDRVNKFYELPEFRDLRGLPEKLVEKEQELDESLGDSYTFSKKIYTGNGSSIYLGKINSWYFLSGPNRDFEVFEDKKLILLHIKQRFDEAVRSAEQAGEIDSSWKGFWNREIESL